MSVLKQEQTFSVRVGLVHFCSGLTKIKTRHVKRDTSDPVAKYFLHYILGVWHVGDGQHGGRVGVVDEPMRQKGVEQCYASYVKHGLNKDDYEGIKYKRIAHIKNLIADGKLSADLRWQV